MAERRTLLLATAAALGGCAQTPGTAPPPSALPRVSTGRLVRIERFESRHVDARPVDVWLPPGYDGTRPHAVLVVHDGQMQFDPASTWNGKAWALDRVLAGLIAAGQARDTLVVAPWNNGRWRHAEFYPQGFLPHLQPPALRERFVEQALLGTPRSDAYLRFLDDELAPAIARRFATRTGREHWCVMGSSMGGLISVYALCELPQRFGAAAALSTHWIGAMERNAAHPDAACAYLERRLPDPGTVRLYLDRGTAGLDALYDEAQARVDALLAARGHRAPRVESHVFAGADHDETAWQQRLHLPLRFLLGA